MALLTITAEAHHVKTRTRGNVKMLSLIEKMKQRVPAPGSRAQVRDSEMMMTVQEATPYRPGKNGFSNQHNTKGSGPADNIYIFYQRLWPGQIASTKSSLKLALGLMHLNFYLFYWPILVNNDFDF